MGGRKTGGGKEISTSEVTRCHAHFWLNDWLSDCSIDCLDESMVKFTDKLRLGSGDKLQWGGRKLQWAITCWQSLSAYCAVEEDFWSLSRLGMMHTGSYECKFLSRHLSLALLVSSPALTPHNLWIYYTSSQCLMALDCFADCLYIIQKSCKICDQHEKVIIKRATATWEEKNTDVIVFPSTNKIEVACLFACFIERLIRFDLSLIKM